MTLVQATASTAQAIYDKMNVVLNKHDIPWDYCVGMSVDNTSVNVGRHNSIKTRVEDANAWIQCISLVALVIFYTTQLLWR
jgi:hypothetical protein